MNLSQQFSAPPTDRAALVCGGRTTSYGQLVERVDRWRASLVASGLQPGDRVGLLSGNDEVFVLGYLACLTAGLITVPLSPMSPAAELHRQLAAVEAKAIIIGEAGLDVWATLATNPGCELSNSFRAQSIAPEATALPEITVSGLDLSPSAPACPVIDVDSDEPAIFLFTSGTAGDPKPAVLTHGNLSTSMQSVTTNNPAFFAEHQVALAVIPLFHVFGINLIVNLALVGGTTLVLEDHAGAARTTELVRENKVTILAGPPTLWALLAADQTSTPADFTSVKLAVSGAARLDPALAVKVKETLGVRIHEGYGLTETGGVLTSSMGTDAPVGSVGGLMPGVEVRLVDLEGENVLVGDVGEVWVRGPMLSPGYWIKDGTGGGRIDPSSQTDDGWLRTGDLAVVDELGQLAIVTRIKDLIIVSGFNVHPTEVETALMTHPSVHSAGVRGEADPFTGERVVAFVVANAGYKFDEAELREHCATELARYKIPNRIQPVLELPVNTIGKLKRQDL